MILLERLNLPRAGRIRQRRIYALMWATGYFGNVLANGDRGAIPNWNSDAGFTLPLGRVPDSGDTENLDGATCVSGTTGALTATGAGCTINGGDWAGDLEITSSSAFNGGTVAGNFTPSNSTIAAEPSASAIVSNTCSFGSFTLISPTTDTGSSFSATAIQGPFTGTGSSLSANAGPAGAGPFILTSGTVTGGRLDASDPMVPAQFIDCVMSTLAGGGYTYCDGCTITGTNSFYAGALIEDGSVSGLSSFGDGTILDSVDMSAWTGGTNTTAGIMTPILKLRGVVNIINVTGLIYGLDGSGGSADTTVTSITILQILPTTAAINLKVAASSAGAPQSRVFAGM